MAVALVACNSANFAPLASPAPTRLLDEHDLAAALRFREAFGLQGGEEWIRSVAADPRATADFGVPLTPDESAIVHRRLSRAKAALVTVNEYARQFPEYGGGYIDLEAGGVAVVVFTGRLDVHRAALDELVAPDAPLTIKQVARTRAELLALKDDVLDDSDWLRSIGAELVSVGIKPSLNMVRVVVSSSVPDVDKAILDHFGAHGAMYVESDEIGVLFMPTGTLVITARREDGHPADGLLVECTGDLPGTGTGDVGIATDSTGRWSADLIATGYECTLRSDGGVVGSGRALVVAGASTALAITVHGQ
jgi:hypothetical protein